MIIQGTFARASLKRNILAFFTNYLLIVLAATVILGKIASPYFLTIRNIENVLSFTAVVSVIAVGQFFVIVTGGIDLSVGSIAALTTVIAAVMMKAGYSAPVASVVALIAASVAGGISGMLVIKARVTPFIATLAMMSIARGVSYLVQVGSLIGITDTGFIWFFSGTVGPVPNPVILFVLIMFVAAFFMRFTTFGRRLYAIGGNAEAARLSGLPVNRSVFSVYLLSGLLSGFGGLVLAAQLTQGSSLLATGYELDTIAAVVVGGAALAGGTGTPIGAVVGGLIIAIIGNIMNLMTIPSEPQLVVKGVLILVSVIFIGRKRGQRKLPRRVLAVDRDNESAAGE
ncbi:MAG: ABC transporter permease [Spirochaetia bacterium]|jgi:ribose transport system permease protein